MECIKTLYNYIFSLFNFYKIINITFEEKHSLKKIQFLRFLMTKVVTCLIINLDVFH